MPSRLLQLKKFVNFLVYAISFVLMSEILLKFRHLSQHSHERTPPGSTTSFRVRPWPLSENFNLFSALNPLSAILGATAGMLSSPMLPSVTTPTPVVSAPSSHKRMRPDLTTSSRTPAENCKNTKPIILRFFSKCKLLFGEWSILKLICVVNISFCTQTTNLSRNLAKCIPELSIGSRNS